MQHGDAADQIVNMATTVAARGAEVAGDVAVKGVQVVGNMTGKGLISLATFLIAAVKSQNRTKGKARLKSFNGKPTKVFVIRQTDLARFAEEAKRYGVLYAAVVNKKQPDGLCDIVVNANDAAKVNRIAERYALSTVEVEQANEALAQDQQIRPEEPDRPTTARKENLNPSAQYSENYANTEKDDSSQQRISVKERIAEMRSERKEASKPAAQRNKSHSKEPVVKRKPVGKSKGGR